MSCGTASTATSNGTIWPSRLQIALRARVRPVVRPRIMTSAARVAIRGADGTGAHPRSTVPDGRLLRDVAALRKRTRARRDGVQFEDLPPVAAEHVRRCHLR